MRERVDTFIHIVTQRRIPSSYIILKKKIKRNYVPEVFFFTCCFIGLPSFGHTTRVFCARGGASVRIVVIRFRSNQQATPNCTTFTPTRPAILLEFFLLLKLLFIIFVLDNFRIFPAQISPCSSYIRAWLDRLPETIIKACRQNSKLPASCQLAWHRHCKCIHILDLFSIFLFCIFFNMMINAYVCLEVTAGCPRITATGMRSRPSGMTKSPACWRSSICIIIHPTIPWNWYV